MKKILYFALMTFVMIGVSACSNNQMDLGNTTWEGSIEIPAEEEGEDIFEMRTVISFSSATDGNMVFYAYGESEDQPFTYTCDKNGKGKMMGTDSDDGGRLESVFEVNGNTLTLIEDGRTITFDKI